jgi:hypothetical protein
VVYSNHRKLTHGMRSIPADQEPGLGAPASSIAQSGDEQGHFKREPTLVSSSSFGSWQPVSSLLLGVYSCCETEARPHCVEIWEFIPRMTSFRFPWLPRGFVFCHFLGSRTCLVTIDSRVTSSPEAQSFTGTQLGVGKVFCMASCSFHVAKPLV